MTVHPQEAGLVWAGGSLEQIRARWTHGDPVGDICAETVIPKARMHQVLEALRHARSDVHYLLEVLSAAGIECAQDEEDAWDGTWETVRVVETVPVVGDLL